MKKVMLCFVLLAGFYLSAFGQEVKADNKVDVDALVEKLAASGKSVIINVYNGTQQKSEDKLVSKKADPKAVVATGENSVFSELGKDEPVEGALKQFWNRVKESIPVLVGKVVSWKGFEIWRIAVLFFGLIGTAIIARLVRWFIEHYLNKVLAVKTETKLDDLICSTLGLPASYLASLMGLYLSFLPMLFVFEPATFTLISKIWLACGCTVVAWSIYKLVAVIDYLLTKLAQRTDNNLDDLIVAIIRKALKIVIVVVSVFFIGQTILGMDISAILAGAGVLGLAIAFAAQDTIANFFGSIMIILDQPFKVGERVNINGVDGTIENVGFRSSRIRTLMGNLVTMPNKTVADTTIENVGKRPFIKHVMNLGLTYDTAPEKMELAVDILHEILDNHEGLNEEFLPRIHFNSFNEFSLNIQVIVWYHPGNVYWDYMNWVHKTDLEILKRFNAEGLEFAFPTNTTYYKKG